MSGSRPTALTKLNTESRELNATQANSQQALSVLLKNPLANGVLLEGIKLVAGANSIEHKLLREVRGYLVVSSTATSTFHDDIQTKATDLKFTLTSSAATTVSLWVF